jgi:hypothetical protein
LIWRLVGWGATRLPCALATGPLPIQQRLLNEAEDTRESFLAFEQETVEGGEKYREFSEVDVFFGSGGVALCK